ncbi:hypothetical protein F5148DRAFT_1292460 [Russula earlei]|uniref:Uncharacterized protein n=1 Tax=Russula earlei TaxID=71964 RepID=A0ACC0TTV9_9AGAM|nr:hypothetical protein F5148DRAFT_1292460 [Russula earlei]
MQRLLFCIVLLATLFVHRVAAQGIHVSGTVRDSLTGKPLANVSIYATKENGTVTNAEGHYTLRVRATTSTVHFRMTGYKEITRSLSRDTSVHLNISLTPIYQSLEDVTVSTKQKGKYTNKNNPAVELIREVIAHKEENRIDAYPTASYEKYEKLCVYMDRFPHWVSDNKLLEKYHFIFENKDTTKMPGKELTPVFIEETVSDNYYRRHPEKTKAIITGQKKIDYGQFIDSRGISSIFNRLYEDVDVYDNQVTLFTRQFTSPIADMAPTFYKFYIRDTILADNGDSLIRLYFTPRNTADLLFTGTLCVTMDGHYAVQQLSMRNNKHMNLGLIRDFSVKQEFTKDTTGKYFLSSSDVIGDFGFTPNGAGITGR